MKNTALIAVVLCCLGTAQARPLIMEETAVLTPPPGAPYVRFGTYVGTNGEYALVDAAHPQQPGAYLAQTFDAVLYRRVNGLWTYQGVLAQGSRNDDDYSYFPVLLGMKGNLASVQLGDGGARFFRFDGSGWVPDGSGGGLHEDVSIDGERILLGVGESWNGQVFEPDGSGGWTSTFLQGQIRCCDDEFWGGPVDLLGDWAVLATPYTFDLEPQEVPVYQRSSSGAWHLTTKLQVPPGERGLGGEVGLHGDNVFVTASSGPYYWNSSNYFHVPAGRLQTVNSYARGSAVYKFAKDGDLLLARAFDPDLNSPVINVFKPDSTGRYEHVAILKPSEGIGLTQQLEIDGDTVIAGSGMRAVIFDLPASLAAPQSRYEDFETGNGGSWTPGAGSQFTVVRPSPVNAVYRQSNLAGDAHSVLGNTRWAHQGVEADIKVTAFQGNDRWVGLATRFVDAQNYYYVTFRSSGTLQLKRMRDGVFTTLASTPLPLQLDRTYRVRLDSIGGTHRVYVDGKLLLTAQDSAPVVAGNAALIMYKAQADYDNVAVSATPRGTIFADDFNDPATFRGNWTHTGPGQWSQVNGAFAQNSLAGDARALIGTPTEDQSVSLRVRPIAFAAPTGSQERWVGVIARHRDDQNYYYLTLRSGNTLSLRKVENGVITTIATVPANVAAGSWYSLKLEALGTTLRAWLNGVLVIQQTDATHARGRTGAVTWKAAAEFDDYLAYQP
jgi:hypothetical protein